MKITSHARLFVYIACSIAALPSAGLAQQDQAGGPKTLAAYLRLFDLGAARLEGAANWSAGDASFGDGLKVLWSLRRMPPAQAFEWRHADVPLAQICAHPDQWRGQLVLVRGWLRSVQPIQVLDTDAEWFGVKEVFRCEVLGADRETQLVLLATAVPSKLVDGDDNTASTSLEERVSMTALVLDATDNDPRSIVAATDRIAWHPQVARPELGVLPQHVWLANLGVDLGQLERAKQNSPLVGEDREGFYQLLAAMGRASPAEITAAEPARVNVIHLLQHGDESRGRLFSLEGTLRRALPIDVADEDVAVRYGIQRYYELEVFAEPSKTVKVRRSDQQPDKIFNSYPVVLCCRRLPDDIQPGENLHESVRITGVYFKSWVYPSEFMEGQASPLLVGAPPTLIETLPPKAINGVWVGLGFIVMLVALAGFLWRLERGDRRFRRTRQLDRPLDFDGEVERP